MFSGFGFCLTYYTSLVMIGFYFDRYRNLAYGFSLTGIGVGIMAYPSLLEHLFHHYGLQGTMLIMGAIQSHLFIVGALTKPLQTRGETVLDTSKLTHQGKLNLERLQNSNLCLMIDSEKEVGSYKSSNRNIHFYISGEELKASMQNISLKKDQINVDSCNNECLELKIKAHHEDVIGNSESCISKHADLLTIPFFVYLICLFFQGVGLYSMYVHFPAYAWSIGVSEDYNAILMATMGAGSLACRIVVGIFTNGNQARTLFSFTFCSYVTAIVCISGPYLCYNYIGQFAFALMFSFFGNVYIALMSPIVIDLMGLERSVVTTGIALFVIGIGVVGGPPLVGENNFCMHRFFQSLPHSWCNFVNFLEINKGYCGKNFTSHIFE